MIGLVTGVPGSGKTLYAVGAKLPEVLTQEIEYRNEKRKRRLYVGGVRNLLLEHEPIYIPEDDGEYADVWSNCERAPGEPAVTHVREVKGQGWQVAEAGEAGAVELVRAADNWWLWCEPGDYIVIDECQRLFRPAPAGRKIPRSITRMETHRHYGIDLLLITQHPQLLHQNVRRLVNPHEHVRRIFGGGSTVIYQWDHCSDPGRTSAALKKVWRHAKKAFKLYKSAEVHTKPAVRMPVQVYVFGLALAGLGYVGWGIYDRGGLVSDHWKPAAVAGAPAAAPGGAPAAAPGGAPAAAPGGAARPAQVVPVVAVVPGAGGGPDPYGPYRLVLEGGYTWGRLPGQEHVQFGVVDPAGGRVTTIALAELVMMGYTWRSLGPCVGELSHQGQARVIGCGPRGELRERPIDARPPMAGASSPMT